MGAHESAESPAGASGDVATVLDAIRRLVRFLRLAEREAQAVTGLSAAQLFVLYPLAQRCPVGDHAADVRRGGRQQFLEVDDVFFHDQH